MLGFSSTDNKTFVLKAFDTPFNKRDYNAAEAFWSSDYIQHSAHIPQGRDGLFGWIATAFLGLKNTMAADTLLIWKHFPAGEHGFFRASILISGAREAVLIDGGFTAAPYAPNGGLYRPRQTWSVPLTKTFGILKPIATHALRSFAKNDNA
jgi:hypothetical protein